MGELKTKGFIEKIRRLVVIVQQNSAALKESHAILEFRMLASLDGESVLSGLIFAPAQEKAERIYISMVPDRTEKKSKQKGPLLQMRPFTAATSNSVSLMLA